jgi:haloalkane dehalogenase
MPGPVRSQAMTSILAGREPGGGQGEQELYRRVVGNRSYPVQVVWAAQDPAMPVGTYGEKARAAAGLSAIDRIPGKHFPQEDQAPAIAARIAAIASR